VTTKNSKHEPTAAKKHEVIDSVAELGRRRRERLEEDAAAREYMRAVAAGEVEPNQAALHDVQAGHTSLFDPSPVIVDSQRDGWNKLAARAQLAIETDAGEASRVAYDPDSKEREVERMGGQTVAKFGPSR
jgi:hypothetical protein